MYRTIIFLVFFWSFSVLCETTNKTIVHKNISVGSHSLHFNYIAGFKPAIVFESGSGLESSHWNKIIKLLSSKVGNAIISYEELVLVKVTYQKFLIKLKMKFYG